MKTFKTKWGLSLVIVLSLIGCENEMVEENLDQEVMETSENFVDFVNSEENIFKYIGNIKNNENLQTVTKEHEDDFFDNFCTNLKVENFESGRIPVDNAGLFLGPLNEFTSVGKFKPGEIESGISISVISEQDDESEILALFGQLVRSTESKVIYNYNRNETLYVDFTENDVQSVRLDVLSFPYPETIEPTQEVTVTIEYVSGFESSETIVASIQGTSYAVSGREPISQISLYSNNEDSWVGLDNIEFGICEDLDGDDCLNDNDLFDESNTEQTIMIGDCDSGVANRSIECGRLLADQIDIIEMGSYKNKGQFMKAMNDFLNDIVEAGIISSEEKNIIIECASEVKI